MLRTFAAITCAFVILSMAGAGGMIYLAFQRGSDYRQENRAIWHNVICLLETQTLANKKATVSQKRQALLFYDQMLLLAHAGPCPTQ